MLHECCGLVSLFAPHYTLVDPPTRPSHRRPLLPASFVTLVHQESVRGSGSRGLCRRQDLCPGPPVSLLVSSPTYYKNVSIFTREGLSGVCKLVPPCAPLDTLTRTHSVWRRRSVDRHHDEVYTGVPLKDLGSGVRRVCGTDVICVTISDC